MFRDTAVVRSKDNQPFIFKFNVTGTTQEDFEKAFRDAECNRAYRRAGNIKIYHDIISWNPLDAGKIDTSVAEAIARKYAEVRNDRALYLGALHRDKEHTHLHLMISGVEAYSGKSTRISKAQFAQVKKEVQEYEQKFQLDHSIVEHAKGSVGKSDREYQVEARAEKISRKQEVKNILEQCYTDSMSRDQFYQKIKESGLEMYERGGTVAGIADTRHMRFSTLGFGEKIEALVEREDRMKDMEELRDGYERESERREILAEKEDIGEQEIEKVQEKNDGLNVMRGK